MPSISRRTRMAFTHFLNFKERSVCKQAGIGNILVIIIGLVMMALIFGFFTWVSRPEQNLTPAPETVNERKAIPY